MPTVCITFTNLPLYKHKYTHMHHITHTFMHTQTDLVNLAMCIINLAMTLQSLSKASLAISGIKLLHTANILDRC